MTTEEQASPAPQRPFPTEGSTDELLHDPPELGVGGTLEGYRRGARMRFVLIGFGAVLVGVLAVLGWWITRPRPVVPEYTVAPDHATDPADRVLHWESEGTARLGMTREPPGVEQIVLPDRVLRLEDGIDHAQVSVEIRGGRTVSVRTLTGRVHMEPRSEALEPTP